MSEQLTSELPSSEEIVKDMDILRHTLGVGSHIPKRDWGYRNYFNAGDGHGDMPSLLRLCASGLMRRVNPEYWMATEAGMRAIAMTAKQMKRSQS